MLSHFKSPPQSSSILLFCRSCSSLFLLTAVLADDIGDTAPITSCCVLQLHKHIHVVLVYNASTKILHQQIFVVDVIDYADESLQPLVSRFFFDTAVWCSEKGKCSLSTCKQTFAWSAPLLSCWLFSWMVRYSIAMHYGMAFSPLLWFQCIIC